MDDRLGRLGHEPLLARRAGQPPAQPLSGELDRRQRILDLVGDPLGDLAPRRHPLGLQELGQVVEDHDGAGVLAVRAAERGRGGNQRERGAAASELDRELGAGRVGTPHAQYLGDYGPQARPREDLLEQPSRGCRLVHTEHAGPGAVDRRQAAQRVERDHAGGDGLEDRLDVHPSILELGVLVGQVEVGLFELPLRLAEIVGHAVEGADQHADLVVAARLNLVGEVAGGDLPCALGQLLDRARDPTRQIEREPREREHDDQGHQQE